MQEPQPLDFEKPIMELQRRLQEIRDHSNEHALDFDAEVEAMEAKIETTRRDIYGNLNAWQRVQIARHTQRPYALDYVERCFTNWNELHGDRLFADDKAMPCGLAMLGEQRCVVITNQKGRNTKENVMRNFGCAHPEGYRKALRLMQLGQKFSLPIISLIDTPGAYPGLGAEERGQAEAIAYNLREMVRIEVPIVVTITGEGGSGGALAIAVGDRVLMMENSIYSVISPEGCASIMWRDAAKRNIAATAMKITPTDLSELGIIDGIVTEPSGGAHTDHAQAAELLGNMLHGQLTELKKLPVADLLNARYAKFRNMAQFFQVEA